MTYLSRMFSPVGILEIKASDMGITSVSLLDKASESSIAENPHSRAAVDQLREYFLSKRTHFDLSLDIEDHPSFYRLIWRELNRIPIGIAISYEQLAKNAGNRAATRAAATACGKNPIAIIIPCHRVIGKNGRLTGYAGGLERKKWLLNHEWQYRKKPDDMLF